MVRICICLPNLNNRRFLPERLETIFQQTFTDWELVVVDNHSEDGAWEFFQEQAARMPRRT
jgi:glycosyltransferase involved in cell wall biosynthesis